MMTTPCPFDPAQMSFIPLGGSPVDQARCLLRFVKRVGDVDDAPINLPQTLAALLATPLNLGVSKSQLRSYLQAQGIPESTVGGPVTDRVCHADSDNPSAPLARYFVIHDTSTKLRSNQDFDPAFINSANWSGNRLANLSRGKTHIYITRLGETLTDNQYTTPWRATQFELSPPHTHYRGLFLHHELVQPRKGPGQSDADAPNPGFTPAQYTRLALQYIIASVRRGNWMVPAFHCVLDLHVGTHDDPQHFDLAAWDAAIASALTAVRGPNVNALRAAVAANAPDDFRTPAAQSRTKDRKGGSTTTGLHGRTVTPGPGVQVIDAVETLTAFRDGRSLGPERTVRQVRTKTAGATVIEQPDYCWGTRSLPNAELVDSSSGLGGGGGVFKGKATFFGKSDTEDEGTGTAAFGTVQTDSSVFGISLKKARLLELELAREERGVLHPTDKGLRAVVEVFFPATGRLARLPLVDVGPGNAGAARTAIADLTVAATAFLQDLTEDEINKLDNIIVQARVIA